MVPSRVKVPGSVSEELRFTASVTMVVALGSDDVEEITISSIAPTVLIVPSGFY